MKNLAWSNFEKSVGLVGVPTTTTCQERHVTTNRVCVMFVVDELNNLQFVPDGGKGRAAVRGSSSTGKERRSSPGIRAFGMKRGLGRAGKCERHPPAW